MSRHSDDRPPVATEGREGQEDQEGLVVGGLEGLGDQEDQEGLVVGGLVGEG